MDEDAEGEAADEAVAARGPAAADVGRVGGDEAAPPPAGGGAADEVPGVDEVGEDEEEGLVPEGHRLVAVLTSRSPLGRPAADGEPAFVRGCGGALALAAPTPCPRRPHYESATNENSDVREIGEGLGEKSQRKKKI